MAMEYFTVATFRASSGQKWWRVNRDDQGNLSCTCPGWCRRVASDGSRTCKHVRKVEEREAGEAAARPVRQAPNRKETGPGALGRRRIRL